MRRLTRRYLAAVLLVLVAAGTVAPAAAHPLDDISLQPLRDLLARQGRVRVLVELKLPSTSFIPEPRLPGPGAVLSQRGDIARFQSTLLARLAPSAHREIRRFETIPYLALEIGADALAILQASGAFVERVVEDAIVRLDLSQSGPLVEAPAAWDLGYDGTGQTVAIVDTGVLASHAFLAGKVVEEACYSSNVSGQSTAICPGGVTTRTGPGSAAPCPMGGCDHGTHVAGIAAGNGGPAGVVFSGIAKGATIMAVQVFSRFTSYNVCGLTTACPAAWSSDIIAGLERVYELRDAYDFAAVNLSLGESLFSSTCDGQPYKPIIDNLRAAGIATVVSAGNNGSNGSMSSPACVSSAISVGATTKTDAVASYSNVASFMSLFAPGDSILSSVTSGGYGTKSGTSMAAPHVTGALAVLRQLAPGAGVGEILTALQTTGVPISRGGVTKPRIRVAAALVALDPDAPKITAVSPASGAPGATLDVTIDGAQFQDGAVAAFGPGIVVNDTAFSSPSRLVATITVADTALGGARDVTVTNPDNRTAQLPAAFAVVIPGEIVIDNGGPGTTSTGSWCTFSGAGSFGTGSLYSCGMFTTDTYRWTPTVPATRAYDVYVWWANGSSRSTTAPFIVSHAGGTTTKTFNERTGGGQWVLHGRYTFNAGTSGYVQTSDANGQAGADAVRFTPVAAGPPPPPDTAPPTTTITSGASGEISQTSTTFAWTGEDDVTATSDLVYATRLDPVESEFSAFGAATSRNLSNLTTGISYRFYVKARDAAGNEDSTPDFRDFTVSVPPPPPASEIIIDNGASGTSSTGTWCTSAGSSPYGANSLYSCGFLTTDTYRWTPTIPATRAYDVYVWWANGTNRSTTAPFIVNHAGGSTTKTFNERTGGGQWVVHGRYTFNAGTSGYVQTSDVNGQAGADAVRFVPVP